MSMKDIKSLTESLLGNIKQQGKDRDKHWDELIEVVPDEWKEKIVNLGYQRGHLKIGVVSSVSYQEIKQFHKAEWMKLLNERGSKVKDIKIQLIDELGDQ